jgi:hypothetical protein
VDSQQSQQDERSREEASSLSSGCGVLRLFSASDTAITAVATALMMAGARWGGKERGDGDAEGVEERAWRGERGEIAEMKIGSVVATARVE